MNRVLKQALEVIAAGLRRFPLWSPTAWLMASRHVRKAIS